MARSSIVRRPVARAVDKVSSVSHWDDEVWYLDATAAGRKTNEGMLDWRIRLPDGTTLCDPKWRALLSSLKHFIWSLYTDARGGRNLSAATLGTATLPSLRLVVSWMIDSGYTRVADLDNEASWEFVEHLMSREQAIVASAPATRKHSEDIRHSVVWRNLNVVYQLYKQREAMEDAGFAWMTEAPFDGRNPFDMANREFGAKKTGHLQPIEDRVAIAIMDAAQRMLGHPAEDAIALTNRYLDAHARGGPGNHRGPGKSGDTRKKAAKHAIETFTFRTDEATGKPWRAPMSGFALRETARFATTVGPVQALRRLILDVVHACAIVLQSHAAMRAGELVSLKAGKDKKTGLPGCVKVRPSRSGLTEMLYVEAVEAKVNGKAMEWIIGARPAGSAYVPPPLRAIQVLQDLLEPWRKLGKLDSLFVSLSHPNGLPKSASSVGRPTTMWNAAGQLAFVDEHVDWANVSPELVEKYRYTTEYRPHLWRRTFALFLLRTNAVLLPAISQHFKHLSLLMTEQSYIGNDPLLLEALDSVRVQESTRFFYTAATGKKPMLGQMGRRLAQHRAELRRVVKGKSAGQAHEALQEFVIEHDLRIWDVEHGTCLIALDPLAARCHAVAGTTSWANRVPNYATREPCVCAGCGCYAINDDHVSYWSSRFSTNMKIAQKARFSEKSGEYRVALNRARQSAALLKKLGVDVPMPTTEFMEEGQ